MADRHGHSRIDKGQGIEILRLDQRDGMRRRAAFEPGENVVPRHKGQQEQAADMRQRRHDPEDEEQQRDGHHGHRIRLSRGRVRRSSCVALAARGVSYSRIITWNGIASRNVAASCRPAVPARSRW